MNGVDNGSSLMMTPRRVGYATGVVTAVPSPKQSQQLMAVPTAQHVPTTIVSTKAVNVLQPPPTTIIRSTSPIIRSTSPVRLRGVPVATVQSAGTALPGSLSPTGVAVLPAASPRRAPPSNGIPNASLRQPVMSPLSPYGGHGFAFMPDPQQAASSAQRVVANGHVAKIGELLLGSCINAERQERSPEWPRAKACCARSSDAARQVLRSLIDGPCIDSSQKEDLEFVLGILESQVDQDRLLREEERKRISQLDSMHLDPSTEAYLYGFVTGKTRHRSFREVVQAVKFTTYLWRRRQASEKVHIHILLPLLKEENMRRQIDNLISWSDFDVFQVNDMSNQEPLRHIGFECFAERRLMELFGIRPSVLLNFLISIESQYLQNSYHNALHAADCTHSLWVLLHNIREDADFPLSDLEILSMLLASICHDVGHPGVTNDFRIRARDEMALIYNDKSVNENMHCAIVYRTLASNGCNFLVKVSQEQQDSIRKTLIDAVLATDMALHAKNFKETKAVLETHGPQVNKWDSSQLALNFMLHGADISASSKSMSTSLLWAERVFEEFFAQGDTERELGRPISPLCDRHKVSKPGSQIGFVNFVVKPTIELLGDLFNMAEALRHLDAYLEHYTLEQEEEKRNADA